VSFGRVWAPLAGGIYVTLALFTGEALPFVHFPFFQFSRSEGAVAVPVLLADGELASPEDFTDFSGIDPEKIDVTHIGLGSSVEHKFFEQRDWIRDHRAAPGAPPGPVAIEVGIRVLSIDEHGRLKTGTRVDVTGTARRR
jgi:hypothetical protein